MRYHVSQCLPAIPDGRISRIRFWPWLGLICRNAGLPVFQPGLNVGPYTPAPANSLPRCSLPRPHQSPSSVPGSGPVRAKPPSAQSPFAPDVSGGGLPPPGEALPSLRRSYGSCASPKSSASLCFRSSSRSLQVHANPCWMWDLPDIISAIIRWSPVPIPRERSAVHPSISSRGLTASPLETQDRPFRNLPDATSTGRRRFRGGSNSFMFRLPSLLGPLVAPTLSGQPGRFHHAHLGPLPRQTVV